MSAAGRVDRSGRPVGYAVETHESSVAETGSFEIQVALSVVASLRRSHHLAPSPSLTRTVHVERVSA